MRPSDEICVKDPRGIVVRLTAEQYTSHIANDAGHPEMINNKDAIAKTIKNPNYIFESKDSNPPTDYREVYISFECDATYEPDMCTKVITSTGGRYAEIITAFPAKANKYTQGTKGDALYESKPKV